MILQGRQGQSPVAINGVFSRVNGIALNKHRFALEQKRKLGGRRMEGENSQTDRETGAERPTTKQIH